MTALMKFFGLSGRNPRTIQFGKLTWIGLMIVSFGWTLLLSGVSLADIVSRISGHVSPTVVSINMGTVSECTILTGFSIAILGLLQTGFSALNRFFDSVLERTAKKPDHEAVPQRIEPISRGMSGPGSRPSSTSKPRPKIVERGLLKDRAYVLFGDGSVEVQTMLGLRRFHSFREAADFVG
jgi:hypothetical protein